MSSTYNGNPANISVGTAFSETIPADGDALAAASVNTPLQKIADLVEAIRQGVATVGFSEGFESATFPPVATSKWTAPSTRFGSDTAWIRSTTNPIAGTAAASAPRPQTLSTNSSMGLDTFLMSPSRLEFLWAVNCILNNGDHLDFYVDGTLVFQMSSQVSNTLVGGLYRTDSLREGFHTFDWRFVRGSSASVGSEECQIDSVAIVPEIAWISDPLRIGLLEDCFVGGVDGTSHTITASGSGSSLYGSWNFITNANVGKFLLGGSASGYGAGIISIQTANTAIADYVIMSLQSFTSLATPQTLAALLEQRVYVDNSIANQVIETGWLPHGVGVLFSAATSDFIGWAWDGGNGTSSTWRWRIINNGTVTSLDSNIASSSNGLIRLGVICGTARGISSAVFVKDGKALPGASSIPPIMTSLPSFDIGGSGASPGMRARSITAAQLATGSMDWTKLIGLRP